MLTEYSEDEQRIAQLQLGFSARLRKSAYYIVESTKSTGEWSSCEILHTIAEMTRRIELPRYSDKYRPSLATQPTLKRKDLHQPFFPQEIYESYFNPKKRKISEKKASKKRVNLDDMAEDAEDKARY